MRVETTIQCYEVQGKETSGIDYETVVVLSHWLDTEKVVIKLPDGKTYTVRSDQLIAAITNAQNWCR